jgi:hypothetical protein
VRGSLRAGTPPLHTGCIQIVGASRRCSHDAAIPLMAVSLRVSCCEEDRWIRDRRAMLRLRRERVASWGDYLISRPRETVPDGYIILVLDVSPDVDYNVMRTLQLQCGRAANLQSSGRVCRSVYIADQIDLRQPDGKLARGY